MANVKQCDICGRTAPEDSYPRHSLQYYDRITVTAARSHSTCTEYKCCPVCFARVAMFIERLTKEASNES